MPYTGFKPLVGGGPQRATLPTGPTAGAARPNGLHAATAANDEAAEPGRGRDAALRSTFVDKEEAAMLRAMARLNGDEQRSRELGNGFSSVNRAKSQARAQQAKAMGLVPLDPKEQHEMQRKMAAGYTSVSERAVRVPRVGVGARPERPAPIEFVPHRKLEEDIREEWDDFETPQAPPGRPTRSNDERKDELALKNQFYGRTPQQVLANAPKKQAPAAPPAPNLREQIEDEVAERHDFLEQMRAMGKPVDASTQNRIQYEIADRLQDLKKLEALGGESFIDSTS